MSQIDELLTLATDFEKEVEELIKSAKKKGKFPFWLKKKTKDSNSAKDSPKAIFPANHANVKDNKVHFPITDAGQARNALARSHQYNTAPPWYKGSLSSLQEAVRRAVKKHYPSIEVSSPKKKSSIEVSEAMLSKYGQTMALVDEHNLPVSDPRAIKQYQQAIKNKGENCPVDGIWSPACLAALISFQRKNNIPADEHGKMGRHTRKALPF